MAYVSDIDLPSVFVWKKYNISELENEVYWNNKWLYDNIYTHNSLWTEDFKKINATDYKYEVSRFWAGAPQYLRNGYSIPQLKEMNVSKMSNIESSYGNFLDVMNKATLIWLKAKPLVVEGRWKSITLDIRYFPQNIHSGFNIEIENNCKVM